MDFLDYSFDSVSQTRSDIAGMDSSDKDQMGVQGNCECVDGNSCERCSVVEAVEPTNSQLMTELRKAMVSLKGLRSDVKSSRKNIDSIKVRLHSLESSRPSSRVGSIVSGKW